MRCLSRYLLLKIKNGSLKKGLVLTENNARLLNAHIMRVGEITGDADNRNRQYVRHT